MEIWSPPERNTQNAACFAALGFPIRLEKQIDASDGRTFAVFFIGSQTAPGFPSLKLSDVRKQYAGNMEEITPKHPLLMAMRAMHNFNKLVDWLKTGTQHRLKPVAGGEAMIYEAGQAHPKPAVVIETGDIDAAAALATIGVPVVGIEGYGNQHKFTLAAEGLTMNHRLHTYTTDAALLLRELREGNLADFDDDFMAGYNARKAHRLLLGHIKSARASVLIRKPGTLKRAVVMENASGDTMDKVRNHFRIA